MKIDKHLKITMTRKQIASLMLACTLCDQATEEANLKWKALHDELQEVLEAYDDICFQRKKEEET